MHPEIRRGVGSGECMGCHDRIREGRGRKFIGSRCTEGNPNPPRSSSDSCTLMADGDDEEDGMCEGEVNRECG